MAAAAKNFPFLEKLHIYFTSITKDDIEIVGRSCPLLKSFIFHAGAFDKVRVPPSRDNDKALAIARYMPELRLLALIENNLTNEGLQAILDGCPHLESIDLRCCCCIDLEGDLGRRCRQQIVDIKHPHDSTLNYEFDYKIRHHRSFEDYRRYRFSNYNPFRIGDIHEYDYYF